MTATLIWELLTDKIFDRLSPTVQNRYWRDTDPEPILWFDQHGHPVVPTCDRLGRRAQRRSRMAVGHRACAARSVLDGREHGCTLTADGRRLMTRRHPKNIRS